MTPEGEVALGRLLFKLMGLPEPYTISGSQLLGTAAAVVIKESVLAEREACALIADNWAEMERRALRGGDPTATEALARELDALAKEIRYRPSKTVAAPPVCEEVPQR